MTTIYFLSYGDRRDNHTSLVRNSSPACFMTVSIPCRAVNGAIIIGKQFAFKGGIELAR